MANFDSVLSEIFGTRNYDRATALEVLKFCEGNPSWCSESFMGRRRVYSIKVLEAMDKALMDIYHCPTEVIFSKSRIRDVVEVRQMCLYIFRQETGYSFNEVGDTFHKNHSTVIHSCRQVEALRSCDRQFRLAYEELENKIKEYLCD